MQTKHAKGIWTIKEFWNSKILHAIVVMTVSGKITLPFADWTGKKEEAQATAKVIANAPLMVDTLESCLETINIMLLELRKDDVILRHELTSRKTQVENTLKSTLTE